MHTWFAAAADPRIAVAVSLIGVQVDIWHSPEIVILNCGRAGVFWSSLGVLHTFDLALQLSVAFFFSWPMSNIQCIVARLEMQSFGWAVAHEQWHARVASIPQPFEGQ